MENEVVDRASCGKAPYGWFVAWRVMADPACRKWGVVGVVFWEDADEVGEGAGADEVELTEA